MKGWRFVQWATFGVGAINLVIALGMFAAPAWFFAHLGHFENFNRHYMWDTASFLLALAGGLMLAARDPARHRLLIGVGAAGSLIHLLNHVYDTLLEGHLHANWLLDFAPLVVFALLLAVAYYQAGKAGGTRLSR